MEFTLLWQDGNEVEVTLNAQASISFVNSHMVEKKLDSKDCTFKIKKFLLNRMLRGMVEKSGYQKLFNYKDLL